MRLPGNWFKHFSPRDSAVQSDSNAAWRKLQHWKIRRQDHERQCSKKLETFGQSIWLDYIRRDLFSSGKLRRLIDDDGLKG